MASPLRAALLLALSCSVALAQSPPLQCSSYDGSVRVVNGQLEFNPLSRDNEYDIPDYNPGPLVGWYAMANGFNNAVRPGGLPYGESTRAKLMCVC